MFLNCTAVFVVPEPLGSTSSWTANAAVDKVAVAVVEGAADDARVRRFTDASLPGLDLTACAARLQPGSSRS